MNDTITKDQVLNAYNNAPDMVRASFNDEATTQVVMGLQTKFQFQADNASVLGKEVGYLLLGLTDPSKFTNRLKDAGFSEQVITEIAKEITQKIFVPLREKMKDAAINTSDPAIQRSPQVNAPVPAYVPPLQAQIPPDSAQTGEAKEYFHLENKIPVPPPREGSLTSLKRIDEEKLLEDHEEPSIVFNKGFVAPVPARTALRPAVAFGVGGPPPANLPGAMPPQPIQPRPSLKATEGAAKPVPPVSSRPYSVDPYREPIDMP